MRSKLDYVGESATMPMIVFVCVVFFALQGAMWGTSVRDEMPGFLLYTISGGLTVWVIAIISWRPSVQVDEIARQVTHSWRYLGIRLLRVTRDLYAVESVGIDGTSPYRVTVHGDQLSMCVFASRDRAAAEGRAEAWADFLDVPLEATPVAGRSSDPSGPPSSPESP